MVPKANKVVITTRKVQLGLLIQLIAENYTEIVFSSISLYQLKFLREDLKKKSLLSAS